MSTTLSIDNYTATNILNKLVVTQPLTAGLTSIPVVNSEGVTASTPFILGGLGNNGSEKVQTAASGFAPDATHVVLSTAILLPHNEFDPLWQLFGDQINIYRAPNVDGSYPADTSYTLLTTIPINYNQVSTSYTDAVGSNAYWYKVTYKNSVSSAETTLQDSPIVVRGGEYDQYTTIYNIRREAGLLNNQFISDSIIDSQRQRVQFEIDAALFGMYSVPFQPPINPLVAILTEKLAASYLLAIDYGPMASGNSKDANVKLDEYERLMEKIDSKIYILTDNNGNDLSVRGAGGNKSWPNDSTSTTPVDQGGSDRTFRMGMRF